MTEEQQLGPVVTPLNRTGPPDSPPAVHSASRYMLVRVAAFSSDASEVQNAPLNV